MQYAYYFDQLRIRASSTLMERICTERLTDGWIMGREIREVREEERHYVFDPNALVYYLKPLQMVSGQWGMAIYPCTAIMGWWCASRQVAMLSDKI
jgi:hypothetical protein